MIEEQPLPPLFRMASLAACNARNGKLPVVFIGVAFVTARDGPCIVHNSGSGVGLLVAFRAFGDRMFSLQRKFCFFV